jgi:hypothetical protein
LSSRNFISFAKRNLWLKRLECKFKSEPEVVAPEAKDYGYI